MNSTKGISAKGQPVGNLEKEATVAGVLVSPNATGVTNWFPPSFDPETGLFYVQTAETFSILYLTDTSPHPEGWAASEHNVASLGAPLQAIDYRTGKAAWSHRYPDSSSRGHGMLTTAGHLLFTGDGSNHLIAFDPANGKILWHAGLAAELSNGPETYMLNGQQYLVVGAGDSLYAFTIEHDGDSRASGSR
jgi:alcohol dehydrogenase (cytochrome c)